MNRCDYLDPALAWTGVKDTGRGAALSSIGYDDADPAEELITCGSSDRARNPELHMSTADRQLELPDRRPLRRRPHQRAADALQAAGITQPAVRHRSGPRQAADDANDAGAPRRRGVPVGVFSDVKPNPVEANVDRRHRGLQARAGMTASSPSAAARRSTPAS